MQRFFSILLFLSFSYGMHSQLFSLMPPQATGIQFNNSIFESKHLNIFKYEYLFNGGGVAIGDINNDGLNDVFFSGNMVTNKLFLNKGNLQFQDISLTAKIDKGDGINTGVSMMDVNDDGWLDIYVCKSGLNDPKYRSHALFINNKDNTFTDRAQEMGLADSSFSTQAYFHDFDRDGDLDLFLLNHPYNMGEAKRIVLTYNEKGILEPKKVTPQPYASDRYFENIKGHFVDKTISSGLGDHAFGLSAIVADFNEDFYPDIYVSNDYTKPDVLYINNGNGSFSEKSDSFFSHFSYNSMGSDYADIDNDGYDDLMTMDMLPEENYRQKQFRQVLGYDQYDKLIRYGLKSQFVKNTMQWNRKGKRYSDISHALGMALTDWSWAPLIADFDNNGHKDIYITNGYFHDFTDQDFMKYKLDSFVKLANSEDNIDKVKTIMSNIPSVKVNNYFFSNQGGMKFLKNPENTGLDIPSFSNGAAYGDLDNDGDLEIVVNNINQECFVFRNNAMENQAGNYIRVKLSSSKFPSSVYGAKIIAKTPDGQVQVIRYYPVKGFMSSHEHCIHFGLGSNKEVTFAIVTSNGEWVEGIQKKANQIVTLNLDELSMNPLPPKELIRYNFADITAKTGVKHLAKENEYNDFKQEPLLPKRYSKNGPCIAVGDVNGDGLEDFYAGGAKDIEGIFYLQGASGNFVAKKYPSIERDKIYEDGAARFLDFDQDGDEDLIVVCGGNDYPNQMEKYPIRLYINMNKGQDFRRADSMVFPNIYLSSKTILLQDYDKDGDQDIFVGAQIVPGHYGRTPSSFFIKNNQSKFVIDDFSKKISQLGMINAGAWIDMDKDGWMDLILVGEWMSPKLIRNIQGQWSDKEESLGDLKGWWTSINTEDLDGDGQAEIILGNYGVNSRYNGNHQQPMTMLVNDFDQNGSTDAVISTYQNGVSYPVPIRDNMQDQMPFLRKRFNRYEKYSKSTTNDLFTKDELENADTFFVNFMYSCIVYPKQNGMNLDVKKMPFDAQISPVNSIYVFDIDGDGDKDILGGGNDYGLEIETGRMDAGIGLVLENQSNKLWQTEYSNNLDLSGDVKIILPITIQGKKSIIVGRNNEYIQIYQLPIKQ